MPVGRAISGVDLHLDLDVRRPRIGLERALREAVQSGRLAPGTRLPASRSLAVDLGIARNTVAEAYAQLVAEGWLTARQGSGTRVADRPSGAAVSIAGRRREPQPRIPRFDLRAGAPDLAAFPRGAWLTALRRVAASAPNALLGYGDPRGLPILREALAGYLGRVRGVRADPDRIVITSGFTQGLRLVADVLARRGATSVAVEAYGHAAHRRVLRTAGLAPIAIPVDSRGAVVEALDEVTAGAVVLTPAHQFPLGGVLAPARRQEVLQWAQRADTVVLEDDYDGEFRYDRQPVGALQGLDPERVIYAGSVSKTLVPAIRLGWLVLPEPLLGEVAEAKAMTDGGTGALDQLAMADLVTSGEYDRIVRRARLAYRRRRDRLVSELTRRVPGARVVGIAAGLHALVELPPGRVEEDVTAAAARRGLRVEGLGSFAADDRVGPAALVVGYSRPPEHAFTGALARLVAALVEA